MKQKERERNENEGKKKKEMINLIINCSHFGFVSPQKKK